MTLGNLSPKILKKIHRNIFIYFQNHMYNVLVQEIAYPHLVRSKNFTPIGNIVREFNLFEHKLIKDG